MPSLTGKTCVVTGSTSGIGRAASEALAAMGATTVLCARDPERAERARSEIVQKTGNDRVHVALGDLSSQRETRALAADVLSRLDRIDVLVNNAGAMMGSRRLTEDGLEWTFALNHLGPFLLTNLLLERLKTSAPSRVVTVSSSAQGFGSRIRFDDLQCERRYSPQRAYGQSKLANVLFAYELARRLEDTGVTSTVMHPGGVATRFGNEGPWYIRLAMPLGGPFLRSPEQGADTVVWLASAPEVEGVTGKYFGARKQRRSSRRSYNVEDQRRLWEISERLTGLPIAGSEGR